MILIGRYDSPFVQPSQVLAAREAACPEAWWFAPLGHADIACALRLVTEAHGIALPSRLAVFAEIRQPFKAPP